MNAGCIRHLVPAISKDGVKSAGSFPGGKESTNQRDNNPNCQAIEKVALHVDKVRGICPGFGGVDIDFKSRHQNIRYSASGRPFFSTQSLVFLMNSVFSCAQRRPSSAVIASRKACSHAREKLMPSSFAR